MNKEIIHHYNSLIDENNDPVQDPLPLQKYMDKWDGQAFIDDNIAKALLLSPIGGSVA